jgi:23S rRNA (cytosine1962-C5)-methyltransferase
MRVRAIRPAMAKQMGELSIPVCSAGWREFELIDSGDGRKLERWGDIWVARPEPKALWRKGRPELWKNAASICDDDENWTTPFRNQIIEWEQGIRFKLRMWQKSKHLGLFPEQEPHWQWIRQNTQAGDKVANLFAYTGSASLVAAKAGAKVTHVDASEPAVKMARENAELSGLSNEPIRWIVEDVMTYLKREERRKSHYEGILLDPPSFGRGPKGQLWKINAISELIDQCRSVLSEHPRFVLLTMYNLEASALTLSNLMQPFAEMGAKIEIGELALKERDNQRFLPLSLFARAVW